MIVRLPLIQFIVRGAFTAFLAVFFCADALMAAGTFVWDGGGTDDLWTSPGNWNPDGIPSNDNATIIQLAGSARPTPVVTGIEPWELGGTAATAGLNLLGSTPFTLSGTTLTFDSDLSGPGQGTTRAIDVTNVSQTVNNNIRLAAGDFVGSRRISTWPTHQFPGTPTLTLNGALELETSVEFNGLAPGTLTGMISGSGGVIKRGDGTWTLTNAGSNYVGTTHVAAGYLSIDSIANAGTPSAIGAGNLIILGSGDATNRVGTLTYTGPTASTNRPIQLLSDGNGSDGGGIEVQNPATTLTINANLEYSGASVGGYWYLRGGGNGVINGNITTALDFTGLIKQGSGAWTLAGNNSYAGATNISGGVLRLNSPNAIPGGLGATGGVGYIVLGDSGVLGLGAGNLTRSLGTGVGQIQVSGGGFAGYGADRDVNFGGNPTPTQLVWGTGGFQPQMFYLGAADADATLHFRNPVNLNGALQHIQINNGSAAIDAAFDGAINGTGGSSLELLGGGTVALTASNTYVGATLINGATVVVTEIADGGAPSNLGASASAAGSLTLNGGTLRYIGSGATTNRLFTLGSSGGTIDSSGSGPIVLNNAGAMGISGTLGPRLTLTGSNTGLNAFAATIVNGASGGTRLTKSGSGTWALGGSNTFTGLVTIDGGTLIASTLANAGMASSLGVGSGAGGITINGGTLRYDGPATSTNRAILYGFAGTTLDASGTGEVTFTGTLLAAGSGARTMTLTGSNGGNNRLAGQVSDLGGATAITKSGAGKWVLSGNNSYSGATTVYDGTLALITASTNNIAGSPSIVLAAPSSVLDVTGVAGGFALAAGQTLSGLGSVVGPVTVAGGAVLSPGSSPGVLTVDGAFRQQPAGTLKIELGGEVKGAEYDSLAIVGAAMLGGTLEVSLLDLGGGVFAPRPGDAFEIITATDGLSGSFATVNLPPLPGFAWDASQLNSAGLLAVIPAFTADFQEDGDVDRDDLERWSLNFGAGDDHLEGDADGEDDVDGGDFLLWQQQAGSGPEELGASAVPEPATAVLLLVACAVARRPLACASRRSL